VTDAFAPLAREIAAALGVPQLNMVVMPHPLGDMAVEGVIARSRQLLPEVKAKLAASSTGSASALDEVLPRVLAIPTSWEEGNDHFHRQGWTDGLPVALPDERKVEALLARCRLSPDEVVGVIPPRMGLATAEKIAVNAVMAGCEPHHFPVVLAAVKAVCRPEFNLLPMQATTNPVAPLIIVNGPIAQRLQFNAGANVLGQGWRSNATVGRALRFVLLNIGGGIPGKLDHACHGQPGKYTFCLAENEALSPWSPFHVDRGYQATDSTVSVIGAAGTQDVIHYARTTAKQVLDALVRAIPREGLKNLYSGGEPLVIFGPEQAAILAREGLEKRDVKKNFFERTQIALETLDRETLALVKGRRASLFVEGDPRALPIADSIDHVQILVAGGAGNHSVFVPTWGDTVCVTEKIETED
jgi:hypothetical protein